MVDGALRARISNEIVRLHSEYYGRGPTKAKVYVDGDLIAVVLEETFTPAERTLIARGESDGIQDIRRRLHRAMADHFKSVIEQASGLRDARSSGEGNVNGCSGTAARSPAWNAERAGGGCALQFPERSVRLQLIRCEPWLG